MHMEINLCMIVLMLVSMMRVHYKRMTKKLKELNNLLKECNKCNKNKKEKNK